MGEINLIVGQQTQAAKLVEGRITELQTMLSNLSTTVDGSMGAFKGSAAAGFGDAIMAWFEATAGIGTQLAEFAAGLYAVDILHGQTDAANAAAAEGLQSQLAPTFFADRLGG